MSGRRLLAGLQQRVVIDDTTVRKVYTVILLGIVLLIIGFVAKVAILWTIGIIVLVIGAVLAIMGALGREVGGRRHFF